MTRDKNHYATYDDAMDQWYMLGWFDSPAEATEAARKAIGHDDYKLYSLAPPLDEVND